MRSRSVLLALISALASCNGPEEVYKFGDLKNITVLDLIEKYFQFISPIMLRLNPADFVPLSNNKPSPSPDTDDTTKQGKILQNSLPKTQADEVEKSLRTWCDSLPQSQLNPCDFPTFSVLMNNLRNPLIFSPLHSSPLISLPISIYLESLLFPLHKDPLPFDSYVLSRTCRGLQKIVDIASVFFLTLSEEENSILSQCESLLSSPLPSPLPSSPLLSLPPLNPGLFTLRNTPKRAEFVDNLLQLRDGAITLVKTATLRMAKDVPKILVAAENLSQSLFSISVSFSPSLSPTRKEEERTYLFKEMPPAPFHYGHQLVISLFSLLGSSVAASPNTEALSFPSKGFVLPFTKCFSTLKTLLLLHKAEKEKQDTAEQEAIEILSSSSPLTLSKEVDTSLLSLPEEELASIHNTIPEAKNVSKTQDQIKRLIGTKPKKTKATDGQRATESNLRRGERVRKPTVRLEDEWRMEAEKKRKPEEKDPTDEEKKFIIQIKALANALNAPGERKHGNTTLPPDALNFHFLTELSPFFDHLSGLPSLGTSAFLGQPEGMLQSPNPATETDNENLFLSYLLNPSLLDQLRIYANMSVVPKGKNSYHVPVTSISSISSFVNSFSAFNPPVDNFLNADPPKYNVPSDNLPINPFSDFVHLSKLGVYKNPVPRVTDFFPPSSNLGSEDKGSAVCEESLALLSNIKAYAESGKALPEDSIPPVMHDILFIARHVSLVAMGTRSLPLGEVSPFSPCLESLSDTVRVMQDALKLGEDAFDNFSEDQEEYVPSPLDNSILSRAFSLFMSLPYPSSNMSSFDAFQRRLLPTMGHVNLALDDLILRTSLLEAKIFVLSVKNTMNNYRYVEMQPQQQVNGTQNVRRQDNGSHSNLRRQNASNATLPNFAVPKNKPRKNNPQQTRAERKQSQQAGQVPPKGTNPFSYVNNGPKASKSLNDKRRPTNEDLSIEVKEEYIEEERESGAGERSRGTERQEKEGEAGDTSNSGRKKVKGENDVAIEKQ